MGYIDINDIPMAMLDKCYLDYENLYDDTNFFFLDEEYIVEIEDSNDSSYSSAMDVIEHLQTQYDLSDFQCRVLHPNGVDFVDIKTELPDYLIASQVYLIPKINNNYNIIVEFLRKNGYFLSKRGIQRDKKHRLWFELVFDPIKQLNIAQQVLNKHRYAYHTTPIQNADSIDIEGIKAQKAFKPYESYQKRVYLYIGNPSSQDYVNMMNDISKKMSSKNKNFVGDFVEYEIRLNKLPQDTDFFIDVHGYSKDFVYITTDIPISAITNSEEKTYG